jgi:GT2 family glycosyltransferase
MAQAGEATERESPTSDAVVDVVVVSYNSSGELRGCVEPLSADPAIRVIVVDNASSDSSVESISDLPVEILALETNRGFGAGCNVGWRLGRANRVLFLNPDARISVPGVLQLSRVLDRTSAGAVAPRIEDDEGVLAWSLRRFPQVRSIFAQALFLHRWLPRAEWTDEVIRDPQRYENESSCDWASGACLLVQRDSLVALDGFDEGFFMYCEDVDLCRRLWDRRERVVYTPEVLCTHEGGASAPRSTLVPTLARSRARYAEKHFGPGRALAFRAGLGLNALTHLLAGRDSSMRTGHARALRATLQRSART